MPQMTKTIPFPEVCQTRDCSCCIHFSYPKNVLLADLVTSHGFATTQLADARLERDVAGCITGLRSRGFSILHDQLLQRFLNFHDHELLKEAHTRLDPLPKALKLAMAAAHLPPGCPPDPLSVRRVLFGAYLIEKRRKGSEILVTSLQHRQDIRAWRSLGKPCARLLKRGFHEGKLSEKALDFVWETVHIPGSLCRVKDESYHSNASVHKSNYFDAGHLALERESGSAESVQWECDAVLSKESKATYCCSTR